MVEEIEEGGEHMIDDRVARRLVDIGLAFVRHNNLPPVAMAVLGEVGEPIIVCSMDGVDPNASVYAVNIAKTSRHLAVSTIDLEGLVWDECRPSKSHLYPPAYFCARSGGVPVFSQGLVIGAVGVAGIPPSGTNEIHDHVVAFRVAALVPGGTTARNHTAYNQLVSKGLLKDNAEQLPDGDTTALLSVE